MAQKWLFLASRTIFGHPKGPEGSITLGGYGDPGTSRESSKIDPRSPPRPYVLGKVTFDTPGGPINISHIVVI